MNEQLITFETAKLAKEKGFDVLCYYYYYKNILVEPSLENGSSTDTDFGVELTDLLENRNCKHSKTISAPTQSLIQKWLREVHNINIYVQHWNCRWKFSHQIVKMCFNGMSQENLNSYEEALEKGLQEALKLIKNV
jgi:hypothetical protein